MVLIGSVVPKPMPLLTKSIPRDPTGTVCVAQLYCLAAIACPGAPCGPGGPGGPGGPAAPYVTFVQVWPPAEGGQGASAVGSIIMGLLAAELTQAKTVWALAFCGPASSRPIAATLARSSLDIVCRQRLAHGTSGLPNGLRGLS